MPIRPAQLLPLIVEFAPLFSKPVWEQAKLLLPEAILAPGNRTLSSCLRIMGKSQEPHFQRYHRVLNRARWSALAAAQTLLRLLGGVFAPPGEIILGIDDTIGRRRGSKIKAKSSYRDRSAIFTCSLCQSQRRGAWRGGRLLVKVAWAEAIWGLPLLTVLCPFRTLPGRAQT